MLERIETPDFLKTLSYEEKTQLAKEMRTEILKTVSANGGHLASNLGSVELTIAIHSVLDMENDKLIFDVGHQCYTHKLLTGRYKGFHTLRKAGGISGFTRISESKYDAVNSGHASDGISLALGYARARDLQQKQNKIAVIIGDGSFTGGMCYEGLNDACQKPTQMLIILNDNEMSISANVGAFSKHLTHLRQSCSYLSLKNRVKSFLGMMPGNGKGLYSVINHVKKAIKTLLIRNDMMFEALGAEYLGPIDGHNIREMEKTFQSALKYDKPVIVHVHTKKGKGYKPAEDNPRLYHGTEPFNLETGETLRKSAVTCGQVACEEICSAAENDSRIVCISAAMLSGTGLSRFASEFPDRCFDVGISEEHAAALAGGLALGGLKPCLALYSTFLQRAYDQININIALNKAPVIILIDRAGLNGMDGETHQGIYDAGFLRAIPGITIGCPSSLEQLRMMVKTALSSDIPYAIRYPKALPEKTDSNHIETGKWNIIRTGERICIISTGRMTVKAMRACDELSRNGIYAGLVDACFIKPVDIVLLNELAERYDCILTVEDNMVNGGLGECIKAEVEESVKVRIMGVCDEFIAAGSVEEQLDYCKINTKHIKVAVTEMLGEKK